MGEAAEAHVKDAQASNHAAAEELTSGQAAVKDASDTVTTAQANLRAYEPDRLKALQEKEAKSTILNNFRQNNKNHFELLRDAESKAAASAQNKASSPEKEEN